MKLPPPPPNEDALIRRAHSLAGYTLGELAYELDIRVPKNLSREKGWSGQLLELALGATAGSKPQQDFPSLGIELKSLPLSSQNQPLETTYVCYAPLIGNVGLRWELSNVKNKLNRVLWVPLQGERSIPVTERMIGRAILWSPTIEQEACLQQDWEELMDLICLGQVEQITARTGEFLQLRPKAANGSVLTDAIGADGSIIKTRPRGFYLKKNFTCQIINHA